jgi:hypothetical protein
MNEFEDLLRRELRRREPPAGFAERVLARLPEKKPAQHRWKPLLALAASLAVATVGVAAGYRYHQAREAKQQLLLALEITAAKLEMAQAKVNALSERKLP